MGLLDADISLGPDYYEQVLGRFEANPKLGIAGGLVLDVFEGKVYRRRAIPAHMTIAEFVTIEESWRICEEIQDIAPSGSFLCNQLEFIVPDINFQFHGVKTYTLGAG